MPLFVSLDCKTGVVNRYRGEKGTPIKTGDDFVVDWPTARQHEGQVYELLQEFRVSGSTYEEPPRAA